MMNMKEFMEEFMEEGIFEVLGFFYGVKFVVRSGLTMKCHGTYDDIMTWMKKTGYQRHEVTSAKLDFIMDVIEIQIR